MKMMIPKKLMNQEITIEKAMKFMENMNNEFYEMMGYFDCGDLSDQNMTDNTENRCYDVEKLSMVYEPMMKNLMRELIRIKFDDGSKEPMSLMEYYVLYGRFRNPFSMEGLRSIYRGITEKYNSNLEFIERNSKKTGMIVNPNIAYANYVGNSRIIENIIQLADRFNNHGAHIEKGCAQAEHEKIAFQSMMKGVPEGLYELMDMDMEEVMVCVENGGHLIKWE